MKTTPQARTQSNPRTYVLQPFPPAAPALDLTVADPLAAPAARLLPIPLAPARPVPPRQPLPTAVIDPTKPLLKLGLQRMVST